MTPKSRRSWLVERVALNELPQQLSSESQRRLSEQVTPEALAELELQMQAFWSDPRSMRALNEIRRGAQRRAWQLPAVALAAGCCALLLVVGIRNETQQHADENRIKGLEPHLVVYRAAGSVRTRLDDGVVAHAGDVLQVGYVAAGERYGAILAVDGAGHVTLLAPNSATETPSLQPSGEVVLPFGYRLDWHLNTSA